MQDTVATEAEPRVDGSGLVTTPGQTVAGNDLQLPAVVNQETTTEVSQIAHGKPQLDQVGASSPMNDVAEEPDSVGSDQESISSISKSATTSNAPWP